MKKSLTEKEKALEANLKDVLSAENSRLTSRRRVEIYEALEKRNPRRFISFTLLYSILGMSTVFAIVLLFTNFQRSDHTDLQEIDSSNRSYSLKITSSQRDAFDEYFESRRSDLEYRISGVGEKLFDHSPKPEKQRYRNLRKRIETLRKELS